ncbi:hypothetical protein SAMN05444408_12119 [Chryseobacterium takakiae]|uniref:Uncharacterized protein n=1 Tax=Chryseobacterium takakiae TaxID=1302685 RepID=A0A1M5BPX4_9FLAO|nr:hypothetical protein SAMN05444408_12119 [Chryseobacterium takakiae]
MLSKQKLIAFTELIFIVFTTNSNNLRKGNDLLSPYEQFFQIVSIISTITLSFVYIYFTLKKINIFDRNVKLAYLFANFIILIFYFWKINIFRDSFYIPLIILIAIKSIIFSFYFYIINLRNQNK